MKQTTLSKTNFRENLLNNQKHFLLKNTSILAGLLATGLSAPMVVAAEPFAEDFSNETNLWTVNYWDDNGVNDLSAGSERIKQENAIQLRIVGDSVSPHRGMFFTSPFNTDSGIDTLFSATIQADESSIISESGEMRVRILHNFHNTQVDGGFPDREGDLAREGNIRADLQLRINPAGNTARVCFDERDADGRLQEYLIFENNSEDCARFELEAQLGEIYTMTFSMDRDTSVLEATVNDETISVQLPTDANLQPLEQTSSIEVSTDGDGDISVLNILAVETDAFIDDFRVTGSPLAPIFSENSDERIIRGSGDRRPFINNGMLDMTVSSDDGSIVQSRINLEGETDYLETMMSLSADTSFESINEEDAVAFVRLSGNQYDAFADGGINGDDVGGVWGRIEIFMNEDRSTGARYCLERFDTGAPNFDSTPVLSSGETCNGFTTVPELDQFYLASLVTDRDARTVTFTLGDEVAVHEIIESEIFQEGPDRQFNAVRSRLDNARGTVVGFADNLRNDPLALTREELEQAASASTDVVSSQNGGSGSSGTLFLFVLLLNLAALRRRTFH